MVKHFAFFLPLLVVLCLMASCQNNDNDCSTPGIDSGLGTDSGSGTDSGPDASLDSGSDAGDVCDLISKYPLEINELDSPKGYHDLVFDSYGYVLGNVNKNILKVKNDQITLMAAGVGDLEGMDFLPNGDIVAVQSLVNQIIRITPDGSIIPILSDIQAYGLLVGSDGMIYVAAYEKIYRIDPESGDKDVLVDGGVSLQEYENLVNTLSVSEKEISDVFTYKVISFSSDYHRMYIGTLSFKGTVFVLELDDDLNPVGEPCIFAEDIGIAPTSGSVGGWHDGIAVDMCENLYIAEFYTLSLYRVSKDAKVTVLKKWDNITYGHGIKWGSKIGEWKEDALYLPQPNDNNSVVEVVLGITAR